VGALISAVPWLQPHTVTLCLGILVILTVVNLRGVRESGGVFMVPTYVFIGSVLAVIGVGVAKTILSGGHPVPVVVPPPALVASASLSLWLIVKAFSSGCTAMTGVEAVSNGVKAFKEPSSQEAKRTLTVIIAILAIMLAGIAYLVRVYGIAATDPGSPAYQSLLSMLIAAVMGKGWFYWVSIGSILLVLSLSANTAFADFPRLCRAIAQNGYLPYSFSLRGRRLVFSQGVYVLAFLSALLLVVFGGVTDRLIPLYAVGAFLAFTLSQAGMVQHWRRQGGKESGHSMIVNAVGAAATGITVVVVLVAKFVEGAWITVLLIPILILAMVSVKRHFKTVKTEIADSQPLKFEMIREPLIVVPVDRWSRIVERGLRFAMSLSGEVKAVHIDCGEEEADSICNSWNEMVERPAMRAGRVPPELVRIESPYRFVITPLVDYALELSEKNPDRMVAVVVPELVERHWYHYPLHNQRAQALKALLLVRGNQRVVTMNVPWYLKG
jgi:amino acid transporter